MTVSFFTCIDLVFLKKKLNISMEEKKPESKSNYSYFVVCLSGPVCKIHRGFCSLFHFQQFTCLFIRRKAKL